MNEPSRFLIVFAILMVAALGVSGWIITHHWEAETMFHQLIHHA